MTEDDLMRLINAYAAAWVLANTEAERETAAKLRAAIQAYGDERAEQRQKEALSAWQEWAALLLFLSGEPPTHSDLESRDVLGDRLVAMSSDEIDGLEDACRRIGKRLVKP